MTSWEGYELDVFDPDQDRCDRTLVFESWSDGGAVRHTIVTPASSALYTARFTEP